MMKQKILLPMLAGLALVGSFGSMGIAAAQEAGNENTSFVQKLAQKLGVSQDKVQAALNEIKDEHRAEMEKKLEDKLNQAVKDGKISETQKQAILKKFSEAKHKPGEMVEFKNMTPEEKKQLMEQKKSEHGKWAEENGLDMELLRELHGGPHKVKFFMHP